MSLLNVSLSSTQPQGNVVVFRQRLWGLIREMTDRLDGIHALITGAASGIGAACARRMAREGVQLLLADLNGDSAKTLADELGQASVQADVTRAADIERMLDLAYQRWGRLDVVFNNAGIAQVRPLLDLSEEEWDRTLAINLRAVFFVLQGAAKRMRDQSPIAGSELRGKLIQTASIAAYRGGQAYMAHYAASKAGVVSITRTAAQVLAAYRITSNCICPGVVDTPMWRKVDAEWSELEGWQTGEAWKRRTSLIPLGRPETAEDVAGLVSFLASRDSDYMTGQAINIDGGLVMGN
jgi:meso-butanediol dehydrogenase/(S,S)-butanediol dehydrogenase/diacetyl reductase